MVYDADRVQSPAFAFHDGAISNFFDRRVDPRPAFAAAAAFKESQAHGMVGARSQVEAIGALRPEQPLDHLLCPLRAVQLKARHHTAVGIPSMMEQPR